MLNNKCSPLVIGGDQLPTSTGVNQFQPTTFCSFENYRCFRWGNLPWIILNVEKDCTQLSLGNNLIGKLQCRRCGISPVKTRNMNVTWLKHFCKNDTGRRYLDMKINMSNNILICKDRNDPKWQNQTALLGRSHSYVLNNISLLYRCLYTQNNHTPTKTTNPQSPTNPMFSWQSAVDWLRTDLAPALRKIQSRYMGQRTGKYLCARKWLWHIIFRGLVSVPFE